MHWGTHTLANTQIKNIKKIIKKQTKETIIQLSKLVGYIHL